MVSLSLPSTSFFLHLSFQLSLLFTANLLSFFVLLSLSLSSHSPLSPSHSSSSHSFLSSRLNSFYTLLFLQSSPFSISLSLSISLTLTHSFFNRTYLQSIQYNHEGTISGGFPCIGAVSALPYHCSIPFFILLLQLRSHSYFSHNQLCAPNRRTAANTRPTTTPSRRQRYRLSWTPYPQHSRPRHPNLHRAMLPQVSCL